MIYVVDDDPMLLQAYARVLSAYTDYLVFVFSDARDVLGAVTDAPEDKLPDLIITDCEMPGMNGLEFAEGVREAGLNMPIIMISGKHDLEKSDFVNELLRKPVENRDLVARIEEHLAA